MGEGKERRGGGGEGGGGGGGGGGGENGENGEGKEGRSISIANISESRGAGEILEPQKFGQGNVHYLGKIHFKIFQGGMPPHFPKSYTKP